MVTLAGALAASATACNPTDSAEQAALARPVVIDLDGAQARYGATAQTVIPDGATIDARDATWSLEAASNYPVFLADASGRSDVAFVGGTITSNYDAAETFEFWHGTTGFVTYGSNAQVIGTRLDNQGDGLDFEGLHASDFEVRGVHMTRIHDDAIENDEMNSGTIDDSLLDGVHMAFSSVGWAGRANPDGRDNTVTISNTLVRLAPQDEVYRGTAPGHGTFFKFATVPEIQGYGPSLVLIDNVFRVDQAPNYGSLDLPTYRDPATGTTVPYTTHSEGNVIVWLGEGPYPAKVPAGFTLTTDPAVWDHAVAEWEATHS